MAVRFMLYAFYKMEQKSVNKKCISCSKFFCFSTITT